MPSTSPLGLPVAMNESRSGIRTLATSWLPSSDPTVKIEKPAGLEVV
jgi:hypothetical protein